MSDFVKHEPCPDCGSKDNLGVWDDGHKFCFGCGWYEAGAVTHKIKRLSKQHNNKNNDVTVNLPPDCSGTVPLDPAKKWLYQYYISEEKIREHKFKWSEDRKQLVMPVYDVYGNLLMFQGRNFSDRAKSKYYTEGKPEKVDHIIRAFDDNMSRVVVVEDLISAIRISEVTTVLPLWGSHLSTERMKRLAERFSRLCIWLDKDKEIYAIKTKLQANPIFDHVSVVLKEKDPKCYTKEEIQRTLQGM